MKKIVCQAVGLSPLDRSIDIVRRYWWVVPAILSALCLWMGAEVMRGENPFGAVIAVASLGVWFLAVFVWEVIDDFLRDHWERWYDVPRKVADVRTLIACVKRSGVPIFGENSLRMVVEAELVAYWAKARWAKSIYFQEPVPGLWFDPLFKAAKAAGIIPQDANWQRYARVQ